MKYAIIVMDGAADEPLEELDQQTVLEKADIPTIDWISREGQLGMVRTVPAGYSPGSDVAILSVMGYAPERYYSGRAPLEAAARNIQTDPSDWIFRCNMVTICDGLMVDYSAGHINTVQATELIEDLQEKIGHDQIRFYPGVSYRHLMVYRGESCSVKTTAPHDIFDEPVEKYLPRGRQAKMLNELMDQAHAILAEHEINTVRRDLQENPVTDIWLWGQGQKPQMDDFCKKFGPNAAVITAVDLVRGLGRLMGMKIVEVDGATGYLDTNYRGKGEAAIEVLQEKELVIVHVESPDEAGHGGLVEEKIEAIERIDRDIVEPVLKYLQGQSDSWRIMVLPDHPTPIRLRTHSDDPVPFALAGSDVRAVRKRSYSEANA
ncbi:MAG: cofactor-independent phosphoglycerate mutase, partial [Planctomycetes bacterium]|nr:cofactor-independent phosphoglycerate mutase [Planctomycetota bacterium]